MFVLKQGFILPSAIGHSPITFKNVLMNPTAVGHFSSICPIIVGYTFNSCPIGFLYHRTLIPDWSWHMDQTYNCFMRDGFRNIYVFSFDLHFDNWIWWKLVKCTRGYKSMPGATQADQGHKLICRACACVCVCVCVHAHACVYACMHACMHVSVWPPASLKLHLTFSKLEMTMYNSIRQFSIIIGCWDHIHWSVHLLF